LILDEQTKVVIEWEMETGLVGGLVLNWIRARSQESRARSQDRFERVGIFEMDLRLLEYAKVSQGCAKNSLLIIVIYSEPLYKGYAPDNQMR
jgi:hypothetical protein